MGKGNSSQDTKNIYTNYNLQGTQAESVVVGNNNTVTDHGAIAGALNFAGDVVNANQAVSLASMEHTTDMAETAMGTVYDASKMAVNAAGDAVYAVKDAWQNSAKLVASSTSDAAQMVADASAANIDKITNVNKTASDRIERMATAVATDGQNLIAQNNVKNLYIIGGVSALSVIAVAIMAAGAKKR